MSKLEPYKPYLDERLKAGVWNAQVLLRELRERNYGGGYTILTDWLRWFEGQNGRTFSPIKVEVRMLGNVTLFLSFSGGSSFRSRSWQDPNAVQWFRPRSD